MVSRRSIGDGENTVVKVPLIVYLNGHDKSQVIIEELMDMESDDMNVGTNAGGTDGE